VIDNNLTEEKDERQKKDKPTESSSQEEARKISSPGDEGRAKVFCVKMQP
jgi:hypothetical protein